MHLHTLDCFIVILHLLLAYSIHDGFNMCKLLICLMCPSDLILLFICFIHHGHWAWDHETEKDSELTTPTRPMRNSRDPNVSVDLNLPEIQNFRNFLFFEMTLFKNKIKLLREEMASEKEKRFTKLFIYFKSFKKNII